MTKVVRGAITAPENSPEAIRKSCHRLLVEIFRRNRVRPRRILSLLFSVTADLTRLNPASAARELGLSSVALFCVQEARIDDSLDRVIRVLLTYRGSALRKPVPVYLEGARALRPDLAEAVEQ
ncbi:MAG: chorismate mutase [Spirochaetales bacterium]|nr:chorismate mutase [Spirochaetales bacterium]